MAAGGWLQTVYVNDGECSERYSSSTGQLAAYKFYNLVDLCVAFTQILLHSAQHTHYIQPRQTTGCHNIVN